MVLRLVAPVLFAAILMAADKKPITASGYNRDVDIKAEAFLDKEEVKRIVGYDLGPNIVVVEVTVAPKSGKELKVFPDDFLLRSYKDGQKSGPFSPSQIAGKGGLTLSTTSGGGMVAGEDRGPTYGGLGGGMPGRLGGNGGGFGNAAGPTGTAVSEKDMNKEKENPMLKVLKEKVLAEGETTEPVKGLLYFPLEGKHKGKDIAIQYNGHGGRVIIEFK